MDKKRFSGKVGEEYDLFNLACPHYFELESFLGKQIKNLSENFKKKKIKVLEIGCGTGYTTLEILSSNPRVCVYALDNEKVMINQSKNCLQDYAGKKRLKFFLFDVLEYLIKQKSNSFDGFASGFTLHNFDKEYRNKILKEIYRVLKPRGFFINADKYALNNEFEHLKSLEWQLNQFNEKYSKINRCDLIKEWTDHYLEDNKKERIMKESESIYEMSEIGFKRIKIVFRKKMEACLVARK